MEDYKSALTMKVQKHAKYTVLIFDGSLDKAGLESVREQIEHEVDAASGEALVMDFTKLNFINSESIGLLLTLHLRLDKREKKLVLFGADEHVRDVLNVIGMLSIISSYPTEKDMLEALKF
ncbi:MAG TPA: STAS domain-containing protein [Candidatus Gracilibacteria bacterium]|nr:STAS domain-containing protein [Candidatus Gracilibacteria bacterium]